VDEHMAEAKALGVDRIRVSVQWRLLAPNTGSEQKPSGDSSDPAWYGQGKWDRYDRITQLAAKHGLGVLFSITGPSPLWVTGTPDQNRTDVADTWAPDAGEYGKFVTAIGRRYSGSYQDEHEEPSVVPLLPPTKTKSPPLPRVDSWSIWNEPNHGGWLTPQWNGSPLVPQSPRLYRDLADAGWAALQNTGHANDTILLGETAPRGLNPGLTRGLHPLQFIREMYCLDSKLHAYVGAAAEARGCPPTFDAAAFVAAHPALFKASGWAHHPYSLTTAPRVPDKNRDDATLSGVPRLTRTLDRAFATYGQAKRLPIMLTEYGYQTDPPDPTIGVSFSRQAGWLDDATFLAYRNKRIASFAQFLLVDDGPIRQYKPDDPRYWGTFQSGLVTLQGKHKPSYSSFERPISLSPRRVKRGGKVRVFGQLRTAADGQRLTAEVQFRARGSKTWGAVARVTVGNTRGFVDTIVRAKRSGSYRISWVGDGTSRAVPVSVRG
ncbi:MAG: hypothetical protein QOJ29_5143, partial [Thermoleophilaceae bacterium]|nr:hypothetical protein [Thermoleophilaceae bacterium]